jgi:energy-coupling factor transporter ATP-binding protein EcfA2
MSLVKLSYTEYEGTERHWEINKATFSNINLIVGKNSSGKSRLMSVFATLARLLSGQQQQLPYEPNKFVIELELNNQAFVYQLEIKNGSVFAEQLSIDNEIKLTRSENGSGKIRYEKEEKDLEFQLPLTVLAAVNRLDTIQHPFLMVLHQWAKSVVLYHFGTDFGKSQVMSITEAEVFFRNPAHPVFDDPNNLVAVYTAAFSQFGNPFDDAVIADMNALGYSLTAVGSENIQKIINFPVAALVMFTVEKELGFMNPQMQMSQGMFRALALVVHLNICAFSRKKQVILVDDIGEGLDYERAKDIINLLIHKAKTFDLQLIMTSNDRFVMNEVPLEYWSVLKRKGGIVKLFNAQNAAKQFNEFKYLGLNNFDFFASDLFEAEVEND